MRFNSRCLGFALLGLGIALLSLSLQTGTIRGQDKQSKMVHAGEGQAKLILDKDWKEVPEELKTFQAIRRGEQAPGGAAEILDHGAQWFAYRLTHDEYQQPKPGGK